MLQYLMEMEQNILLFVQNNIRNDFLDPIVIFITKLGNGGAIWLLLAVALLCFKKTRKTGVLVLVALAGSLLINNMILKNLVARTRPYDVIPGLTSLIGAQGDFSFPSGHTGSSFAAAVVLFCRLPKKYGIPAMILAVLISLSRIYVGVHYPTDVLAGALIGTGIAIALCKLVGIRESRKEGHTPVAVGRG
ncbi:MAG: phosphatase PAP2 family protein [Lachnospiraceae bacterium]|nr:phosphatase PAP2 family protein [Lachnospiraceae bacterium]